MSIENQCPPHEAVFDYRGRLVCQVCGTMIHPGERLAYMPRCPGAASAHRDVLAVYVLAVAIFFALAIVADVVIWL